jgi:putative glutamine amidotransferase
VVEEGTRLAQAIGAGEISVNSRHHQAVADPGRGMQVCGRSVDGVVEALERVEGPFCVGVQWHPEDLAEPHATALFRSFVDAARHQATGGAEASASG